MSSVSQFPRNAESANPKLHDFLLWLALFIVKRYSMAGGLVISSSNVKAKEFEGKVTTYVVFACFVAASGGLLFGYDIGVTGGVTSMDDFLIKFFPDVHKRQEAAQENNWCKFDDQLLQLFTSSLFLAGIVGGGIASYITSQFGRVRTMLAGGIFFLIGASLTAAAPHISLLIIGRISLGLGVGSANQSVPLYLSEMAPSRLRGAMNMMFQMATTIGILAAQLINYGTENIHHWGWRLSLAMAAIPAFILTMGGIFLPETPNSLIERGHRAEGLAILRKIRGVENVKEEYNDIVLASETAKAVKIPFYTIFQRKYRPQLTFAILIPFFQQCTGINAIMFYVAPLFRTFGFGTSASLYSAVITGAVNVVSTLVSIFTVDKFGRKILFLEGGIQMIVSQVVVAVLLAIEFGETGENSLSEGAAAAVVVVICIYVAGFAWSWGPLGWLVPSEIQPLETRSAGQAITVAINFILTFIIGQAFLSMLCAMKYGIFLFFAAWVAVMTLVVVFFLPETKGVPMEDMSVVWYDHWYWKTILPPESVPEKSNVETDASP